MSRVPSHSLGPQASGLPAQLPPAERNVLKALVGYWPEMCLNFHGIQMEVCETLTRDQVREACRALAAKGLAKLQSPLFDMDTGAPCGAGYGATEAGAEWVTADEESRSAEGVRTEADKPRHPSTPTEDGPVSNLADPKALHNKGDEK